MLTALINFAKPNQNRDLSGFAGCNVVAGESIDVEGPGDRRALHQARYEVINPRILFVCVALGILRTFPKAQRKDLVGLGIRQKQNLVHEPRLVFKDWEDLIVNGFGELSRFSRLGFDGDDSTEHGIPPFGSCTSAAYARQIQRSITEKWREAQTGWDVRERNNR
jgi:hypothetical protein